MANMIDWDTHQKRFSELQITGITMKAYVEQEGLSYHSARKHLKADFSRLTAATTLVKTSLRRSFKVRILASVCIQRLSIKFVMRFPNKY
jgi:hypothetical protein